jgi:hypothetical protein
MENNVGNIIIDCVLLFMLSCIGYFILITYTNTLLNGLKYKKYLKKDKRFNGKETPIYEYYETHLSFDSEVLRYIRKWELKYHPLIDNENFRHLVPFAGLFLKYGYVSVGSYYIPKNVKLETLDIEKFYEEEYQKYLKIKKLEEEAEKKEIDLLDKINSKFNKNYIK